MKRLVILSIIICLCTTLSAKSYSVEEIPNPILTNPNDFVADPAHLLSPATVAEVNARLKGLCDTTSAEMAVVVVPSIEGDAPEEFATALFKKFGLGKRDKDNGVLLLIAPEDHVARFEVGYGLEGILPDITMGKIMRQVIIPAMKEGKLDEAVNGATAAVSQIVSDPEHAGEVMSKYGAGVKKGDMSNKALDRGILYSLLEFMAVGCFLIIVWLFVKDSRKRGRTNYQRAIDMRSHLDSYLILGILSAGFGLPFYFLAKRKIKKIRNTPITCDTCGHKMNKLNEEEDNALLNGSQDFEERLNTVDYDVWVCPECGTIERLPFKIDQKKYSECPKCHTIAEHLVMNKIVQPATTKREGLGVKTYECRYCGNRRDKSYKIPKKDDGSGAAAVAGAVLGSALGGRGGGGGFGGGSFGGGRSGGGGATGRW